MSVGSLRDSRGPGAGHEQVAALALHCPFDCVCSTSESPSMMHHLGPLLRHLSNDADGARREKLLGLALESFDCSINSKPRVLSISGSPAIVCLHSPLLASGCWARAAQRSPSSAVARHYCARA